ncbi:MAG: leucine-rich repeat domain-containing protein [Defluviitaleaceae bacterium]|nr:leucine-rich repeat domain-containing protein [Defluviitaleaceae bacterium]
MEKVLELLKGVLQKSNTLIGKLPFKGLAEKHIPAGAICKVPFLVTIIALSNYIALGLAALLLVAVITPSGENKNTRSTRNDPSVLSLTGRASNASDFTFRLNQAGNGVIITGVTGGPQRINVPARIDGVPVTGIDNNAFNGNSIIINFATADFERVRNAKAGITSITIPNTVTSIGNNAFANTAITSFNIPNSVTRIGTGVFANTNLRKIVIPSSIERLSVEDGMHRSGWTDIFSNCIFLEEIVFPDNMEIIPRLYSSRPALKKMNLPRNLKYMTSRSLSMPELVDLIIPDSLTEIIFVEYRERSREVPLLVAREIYSVYTNGVWRWFYTMEEAIRNIEAFRPLDPRSISASFSDEVHVYYNGWYAAENHSTFRGSQKLPLRTRQRLIELGYNGEF